MTGNIGSIAFYSLICLIITYLAWNIDRKRNVRFYICMLILFLTLVAGLRHQSVGIDTQGYVDLISVLRDEYHLRLNNITEQGFIFLSYILVNVSEGYTLALVIYAFLTNALIIFRLYDYKEKISLTWAVFIYYMIFYFTTFNTIRQWLAMAIVFYGTRYICDNLKSNIRYMMFVLLAMLMHTTAILTILFVPLYYFSLSSENLRIQIRKCIMIISSFFGVIYIYSIFEGNYSNYLSSTKYGDVSWVNIILLLFGFFIMLYDNNGKITIRKNYGESGCNSISGIKYESLVFVVGVLFTLMVYFFRYADRIGQYFILFELVFFPYYIRKTRTRIITIIFVLLLCLYLRIPSFLTSGYGEVPYIPFWM